jgi:hypothetical protein
MHEQVDNEQQCTAALQESVQRHTLSYIPHNTLHGHLMPLDVPDAVPEDDTGEQVCGPDSDLHAYND